MTSRNWKHPPQSLPQAMAACLKHGQEKHRRSVERIAGLMGLSNPWTIYKWVESGRIPAIMIGAFEHACGADHVTRYLAHAGHRLIIDIPTGRALAAADLQAVQAATHAALGALIDFAAGNAIPSQVIEAVTGAMEQLAWHRENARKADQPELALEGEA